MSSDADASAGHTHLYRGVYRAADSARPVVQQPETVKVVKNILADNDNRAEELRRAFTERRVTCINVMGSPGAGKTSLISAVSRRLLQQGKTVWVLEGDLATDIDTVRLRDEGIESFQITTGSACHLDAWLVKKKLTEINQVWPDYLFIENVGNLVCPAAYDVGSHINMTLLSVPEGADKVGKYPVIFKKSDVLVITKTDSRTVFDFDQQRVAREFKVLNEAGRVIEFSTRQDTAKSIEAILDALEALAPGIRPAGRVVKWTVRQS